MFNNKERFEFNKKIEDFDFFFVRGAPARSGTNWVNNLLNLHPEIYCSGEFNLNHVKFALDNISKVNEPIFLNQRVSDFLIKDFENMVRNCIFNASISGIKKKPDVKWLGDRTPVRFFPPLIRRKPHFLVYRDGRDVLVSLTYHHLRIDLKDSLLNDFPKMNKKKIIFDKNPFYFKDNPRELLDDENWVKSIAFKWNNQMSLRQIDLENIKAGKIDAKVHLIRYEDLHTDVEGERKKMYEFLGLNPKKAMSLDKITSPGFKNEDFTSHYRKGMVGDWKNYFTKEVCDVFKKEAGQKLIDLNYERDMEWEGDL